MKNILMVRRLSFLCRGLNISYIIPFVKFPYNDDYFDQLGSKYSDLPSNSKYTLITGFSLKR